MNNVRNSAITIEHQTPFNPKNIGKIKTEAICETKVLEKGIIAEIIRHYRGCTR